MDRPRLTRLSLRGYRSIDAWLHVDLPVDEPLVLLGENNAGKSNILRSLNLLFGDFWPGNHQPEDHEYFGREAEGNEIVIVATTEGLPCSNGCHDSWVEQIRWSYAPDAEPASQFVRRTSGCTHTWMNNALRQALFCMSVGVNRDLSYQLSYGSKWTTLSKLMRRFHDRLVADPERVDKLKAMFDSLVGTFHEVEEFQHFGDALRSSFADFGGNLRYGLGIDFSAYDPSNFFRSLRVFPHVDGEARTYEELGTGQEQVLAMAFAYAYAQAFGGDGLLLAIEEPESHLHPLAQQWLARKLRLLAAAGVQVVVTTHSPYFVNVSKPWATVLVRKDADNSAGTTATQYTAESLADKLIELGAPPTVVTAANVGEFYESAASYETLCGFFSRACILVEGATEAVALTVLLERAGLDLLHEGIAVVPVEGITNMAKWARLYGAYGIPVYAVFDTDTDKPAPQSDVSLACANEVLAALGVSGPRESATGRLAPFAAYSSLDPNYETSMRTMFGTEYVDLEAKAAVAVGKSKPLKAKYCAINIAGPDDVPASWAEIKELVRVIRTVVPGAIGPLTPSSKTVAPASAGAVSRPAAPRPH